MLIKAIKVRDLSCLVPFRSLALVSLTRGTLLLVREYETSKQQVTRSHEPKIDQVQQIEAISLPSASELTPSNLRSDFCFSLTLFATRDFSDDDDDNSNSNEEDEEVGAYYFTFALRDASYMIGGRLAV